jgi:hypothetical protein
LLHRCFIVVGRKALFILLVFGFMPMIEAAASSSGKAYLPPMLALAPLEAESIP